MRAIRGAVASSLVLALAACAFAHGPEPLPPTRPLDENVLTLDRAVNLALANSPTLAQSRAKVEQAQGLAIQAGLYPNPQENSGNPLQFGGANSSYSIGVQQEIVRAGKIPLNRAAAEQGVRQANLDFVRQQFDLVTAVRQQFYTQLAAQKRIETLRKMQNLAQQSLDISIKLKQNEQVAETDILLLQIELQRLAVSLRSSEQVILAGTQQLAAIIGLPNLRIDRVAGELTTPLPDFNDPSVRG
jgi:cobalt-zinc-cadmium efflux system outer membrane protein